MDPVEAQFEFPNSVMPMDLLFYFFIGCIVGKTVYRLFYYFIDMGRGPFELWVELSVAVYSLILRQ